MATGLVSVTSEDVRKCKRGVFPARPANMGRGKPSQSFGVAYDCGKIRMLVEEAIGSLMARGNKRRFQQQAKKIVAPIQLSRQCNRGSDPRQTDVAYAYL
ncbi:hypothetical protein RHOFW510R12_14825 [Rhodanobacter sp. FW510-R12]